MTPRITKLLVRAYQSDDCYDWDQARNIAVYRLPDDTPSEDVVTLEKAGWLPGRIQTLSHDGCIERLIAVRDSGTLSWSFAAGHFLAGLSGTFPRGRSAVLDFLAIRDLIAHPHEGDQHCETCGLQRTWSHDTTEVLLGAYLGHSGNEVFEDAVVRVEEMARLPPADVSHREWTLLSDLLNVIAEADPQETPSALEKRIGRAKLLPKTDKYRRYGILQTLAECGILPNDVLLPGYDQSRTRKSFLDASRQLKDSPRSDIVLPLAGWRGRNGVDLQRARELFAGRG